jgi:hypothetical protein
MVWFAPVSLSLACVQMHDKQALYAPTSLWRWKLHLVPVVAILIPHSEIDVRTYGRTDGRTCRYGNATHVPPNSPFSLGGYSKSMGKGGGGKMDRKYVSELGRVWVID